MKRSSPASSPRRAAPSGDARPSSTGYGDSNARAAGTEANAAPEARGPGGEPGHTLTLEEYAEVSVRLALFPEHAQRALHERGLSDAAWEAASARWDERLSQALDDEQADGAPAPFAVQYAEAIQRAQLQHSGPVMDLDIFCSLLAAMRAGKLPQGLHSHDLSMGQFIAAQSYWMQQASKDPALRQRLTGQPPVPRTTNSGKE